MIDLAIGWTEIFSVPKENADLIANLVDFACVIGTC